MTALLTIIHVVICIILVVAVLLQSGKAADLAGAFGGGGSQTAFGPRSTQSIMSRITTICAILFMFTSLGLWLMTGRDTSSAVKGVTAPAPTKTEAPAVTPKTVEKKAAETPVPSNKTAEQKPAAADPKK